MPRIEQLRNYPVAGIEGYQVNELIITPEAILGNRSFAIVLESEIGKMLNNPNYAPRRLTQVNLSGKTKLTRLQGLDKDGKLVIQDLDNKEDKVSVENRIEVEDNTKPFYDKEDVTSINDLLNNFTLPFQVSERSSSKRWAEDCGDEVADWLSEKIGPRVRLVKAVAHPDTKKHHFTWYTQVHAVTQESIDSLSIETESEVDPLSFRYNILLSGSDAFEEENWKQAIIGNIEALVTECQRCGYIGINRDTGIRAQHMKVLTTIMKKHDKNFGVYIKPQGESFSIVIKVGDEIIINSSELPTDSSTA
jgi:uncharacterized protein YcbX